MAPRHHRHAAATTRRRLSFGSVAAALLLLAGATVARAAPEDAGQATFDYLHVEANEGSSSGGHAAVRVGNSVYDFTHQEGGLLRLRRQHADDFLYAYAFLQNRPLHVVRVRTSAAEVESLRETLATRNLAEHSQFDLLDEMGADERLSRALATDPARARVRVEAAGYFLPSRNAAAGADGALTSLKRRIEERDGAGAVRRRRNEAALAIESLEAGPLPTGELPVSVHGMPAASPGFHQRVHDRVALLVALDVLDRGLPLRDDALRTVPAEDLILQPEDLATLRDRASGLRENLADLFDSSREDRGPALLIGMARLAAMERSIVNGRLMVPELVDDGAQSISHADLRDSADLLGTARREAREDLAASLRELRTSPGEIAWGEVELAATRSSELAGAIDDARPLHLVPDDTMPVRSADIAVPKLPRVTTAEAARQRDAATTAAAQLRARLEELYGYSLTGRNCATALLDEIDTALGTETTRAAAAGDALARHGLAVIPFVSADRIAERWPDAERFDVPSWREAQLAALRARPDGWKHVLRESNTWTSRLYRRSHEDSVFLLFADSVAWRPLAGAVNLAAGAGAAMAGALTLPFGGSRTLMAGLRGMAFSVPELAFVRIRRGSYDFLDRRSVAMPARWRPGDLAAR